MAESGLALADALGQIAESTTSTDDLDALGARVHAVVAARIDVERFRLVLLDDDDGVSLVYDRDRRDRDAAVGRRESLEGLETGDLLSVVLRSGRSRHVSGDASPSLVAADKKVIPEPAVEDWLGVPLRIDGRTIGAMAVRTERPGIRYTDADAEALAAVATHVSSVLARVRATEETKRRDAELAIVNEIGTALAANLEFDAIVDLVGDRIRDIFQAPYMYIALLDHGAGIIHFPYNIEAGERFEWPSMPIGNGLTSIVISSRQPLVLGTEADQNALGAIATGGEDESYLGVPMLVGDRVLGVIAIANARQHAFGPAEVRLLTTLAASTGVALENARLFKDTRRRAAELEIVNRVGRALASQVELDSLIDLVGDLMGETFDADIVFVALVDPDTQSITFPYYSEDGRRVVQEPMPLGQGLTSRILETRQPLLLNRDTQFEELGTRGVGRPAKSWLGVPILSGEDAIGVITVESSEHEGRFGEGDASLLTTLAASVGAALHTAELFRDQERREAQYRRLVEELPLAIYTDRPDDTSTSTYISPIVEELFGYPREAWLQEGFFTSILHPDDRSWLGPEIVDNLVGTDQTASYEYRIIAADGRVVWIRDDSWIVRDAHGAPQHLQGFMLDITDQVSAAAEIRRQKQYFEALVEISPVAVVTMDSDESVTGWNPAATHLFGYEPGDAIGHPIDELLLAPEGRDEGRALTRLAEETGLAQAIGRRLRQDRTAIDVEIILVPLVIDGERTGYYAIYHDISELQAARREADASNTAKSTFLAAMSHEIRTPMNAIIGMSGLLVDTALDPEQRDYAETIRTSGEALLTIINEILDFSKIEAGRVELERRAFTLGPTIEATLDVIAPAVAAKGLEFAFTVDPSLPAAVVGDAGRLRQILLNLLSNAVKFTESGEVVLTVGGHRLDKGRDRGRWQVVVEVRDTGIGVPPDRIDRLFESFTQADASIARRFGGTGLGLAISRRLAELMDGSLVATSSGIPGEGTTFRLTITVPEATASAEETGESAVTAKPTRRGDPGRVVELEGQRVLIVDDSDTTRRILVAESRRLGLVTRDIGAPREALGWVEGGEPFDLALVDLRMPDLDGPTLAGLIRAATVGRSFPIVIIGSAGYRWRDDPSIDGFVAKPVKPSHLLDTILTVMAERAGGGGSASPSTARRRSGRGGRTAAAPASAEDPVGEVLADHHPLRILLAEDNVVNQKLAARLLERMGYTVELAGNGLAAVEAASRATFDIIFMDVQMPELDGLEATRRLRAGREPGRGPRIVAMTANAMAGDREACLAAGMDDYLSKPIRVDELRAALLAAPRRPEPEPAA